MCVCVLREGKEGRKASLRRQQHSTAMGAHPGQGDKPGEGGKGKRSKAGEAGRGVQGMFLLLSAMPGAALVVPRASCVSL